MVTPEWPPMTGTDTWDTSRPFASATKVLARTISRVVTPKMLHTQVGIEKLTLREIVPFTSPCYNTLDYV